MFRLVWFLIGIAIGAWIVRPVQEAPRQAHRYSAPKSDAPPPAEASSAKAAKPAPPRKATAPAEPDPLIDIKGIGPTALARLTELGITTFAQVADETPESLAEKMGGRITAERIKREDWIGQAKASAKKD